MTRACYHPAPPMNDTSADPLKPLLKRILVERLRLERDPSAIGDADLLFDPEGLGLDSIDALELVLGVEQELGVQLGNEEVSSEALESIDRLAAFLREKHPDLVVPAG